MSSIPKTPSLRGSVLGAMVVVLLAGLPIAVWLDLRDVSNLALRRQASDVNSLVTGVRGYYASNVVARVQAATGPVAVVHNYRNIPGAIPVPATLSLELGRVINEEQHNITYRFISDYPFKNRPPHQFDEFETYALAALRANPNREVSTAFGSIFTNRVRLVTPVIMSESCVECHNTIPRVRSGTGKSATFAASRRSASSNRSRETCFPS